MNLDSFLFLPEHQFLHLEMKGLDHILKFFLVPTLSSAKLLYSGTLESDCLFEYGHSHFLTILSESYLPPLRPSLLVRKMGIIIKTALESGCKDQVRYHTAGKAAGPVPDSVLSAQ